MIVVYALLTSRVVLTAAGAPTSSAGLRTVGADGEVGAEGELHEAHQLGAVLDGRRNAGGEGVAVFGRIGMPAVLHGGDADGSPIGRADAGRRVQRPVDVGDDLHRLPMVGVVFWPDGWGPVRPLVG